MRSLKHYMEAECGMKPPNRDDAEPAAEKKPWFQQVGPAEFQLIERTGLTAWPVLMGLLWYARGGDSCFPSIGKLAALLVPPARTVRFQLAALE